jgi:hypothetical protein
MLVLTSKPGTGARDVPGSRRSEVNVCDNLQYVANTLCTGAALRAQQGPPPLWERVYGYVVKT